MPTVSNNLSPSPSSPLFSISNPTPPHPHDERRLSSAYSQSTSSPPPSSSTSSSHQPSSSRSSRIDFPVSLFRSASLRSPFRLAHSIRSRSKSRPVQSKTLPILLSSDNTLIDGKDGTKDKLAQQAALQRSMSYGNGVLGPPAPIGAATNPQSAQAVYQHITETATKRISTLDYLRKSHEGRVYWFNTLLYTRPDLLKLPYFAPARLARRAQNYLLLGFSLPMVMELNSQTAIEYLKALNALLAEFEQYQSMHPPDGATSSLSRARIPSMFKRSGTSTKSRRMTDSGTSSTIYGIDAAGGGDMSTVASTQTSIPSATPSEPLLPTEQYTHLLTPPLPFDPDFFETFATLCDVLIDCYSTIMSLISSAEICGPGTGVADLFSKVDSRIRKIIVSGVVREFEERCREGVKGEIAGIGKVVLGGLM